MEGTSPRLWPYAANNSPLPLPSHPVLYTQRAVIDLQFKGDTMAESVEELDLEGLRAYARHYASATADLDALLLADGSEPISERRPLLLQGELANPYRLQDMGMSTMPLLPVRLEGICRTWADSLDPRDAYPGVHHVTLARTPGWWESAVIGFATKEQLKQFRDWLDNGQRNAWRPVKLGEGGLRMEHAELTPPLKEDIEWDGQVERVAVSPPPPTGPLVSLDALLVVVHTRNGCYNHRGRLARCVHMQQRAFHEQLFRKGSSHRWDEILTLR